MEIHISENKGFKDEHLPVEENSWQIDVLKKINNYKTLDGKERIFCLEARNATKNCLMKSIEYVNKALS